jgi:hypothetical protein
LIRKLYWQKFATYIEILIFTNWPGLWSISYLKIGYPMTIAKLSISSYLSIYVNSFDYLKEIAAFLISF